MPKYRWEIEFDAADDDDADEQVQEALGAFDSYHSDKLEQIEDSRTVGLGLPEGEAEDS
jgi:hypothetical protein